MKADCAAHAWKCHQCQVHEDLKHMPPMPLHTMTSPQPFSTWGIDIIGKIHPTVSNGHEFILIAIDYFTKWVEVTSYKVLNLKKIAQFIQTNIICKYEVPHDNGLHFKGETERLLRQFNIQHHKSSPYHPQTNGAVEATNKNIGLEEEHVELQGLVSTITLCTLGVQDISSIFHKSHSLFIVVQDGSSPFY